MSEFAIDCRRKITIKAYDKVESPSKGLIMLPIRIGPVEKDVVFQVLDIPLAYTLFLRRPWIHDIQGIPSTYHQCIKFPFNGTEIVIPGDNSMSINTLFFADTLVPHNHSSHELKLSLTKCEQKMKMMSLGMGEYSLDSITSLPVFP